MNHHILKVNECVIQTVELPTCLKFPDITFIKSRCICRYYGYGIIRPVKSRYIVPMSENLRAPVVMESLIQGLASL